MIWYITVTSTDDSKRWQTTLCDERSEARGIYISSLTLLQPTPMAHGPKKSPFWETNLSVWALKISQGQKSSIKVGIRHFLWWCKCKLGRALYIRVSPRSYQAVARLREPLLLWCIEQPLCVGGNTIIYLVIFAIIYLVIIFNIISFIIFTINYLVIFTINLAPRKVLPMMRNLVIFLDHVE